MCIIFIRWNEFSWNIVKTAVLLWCISSRTLTFFDYFPWLRSLHLLLRRVAAGNFSCCGESHYGCRWPLVLRACCHLSDFWFQIELWFLDTGLLKSRICIQFSCFSRFWFGSSLICGNCEFRPSCIDLHSLSVCRPCYTPSGKAVPWQGATYPVVVVG